jgi:ABC-type branched-subunit amino acid transport system ATPase component
MLRLPAVRRADRDDRDQLRMLITGIRDQGTGVALIDHDVKFVSDISDTVLAMNYGKELGTGIPSELLARADVRAAYVGLELWWELAVTRSNLPFNT